MTSKIHPSAIVSASAEVADGVEIGPFCVVEAGARLASGVRLISHVSIAEGTELGADTLVYPFATLGHAPQDTRYKGEPTFLKIGARNVIREHVSMHRGTPAAAGETLVGSDNLFMAGSHVAHDCKVGSNVIFANNATLGGKTEVEDRVTLGGLSAVHQLGRVGFGAFIGGGAPVTGDVIPFGMVDNHGRLSGLNLVGLKRRGASRETIALLRKAYRSLFHGAGVFSDRVGECRSELGEVPEVARVLDFIDAGERRPLCMPALQR